MFKNILFLEFKLLIRNAQEWCYPITFFTIIAILFPLAFSPDPLFLNNIFPGIVWIAALLAILLSIENIFLHDLIDAHLEQLILSPISLPLLILIKLFMHWCLTILPLVLFVPILGLLFQIDLISILLLCLSLVIATPMIVMISALGVALTLGLKQQGVMLSLIILPLMLPLLIFGVSVVKQAQNGLSILGPLAFLLGLLLFSLISIPWAIALTLTLSVDD